MMKAIFSGILTSLMVSSLFSADIPDFPFIFVEGEASKSVPVHYANLRIELDAKGDTPEEAEKKFQSNSKSLRNLLNDLQLKAEFSSISKSRRIETAESNVSSDPFGGTEKPESTRKTVHLIEQMVKCSIDDLTRFPAIIEDILKADCVADCYTSFYPENYRRLQQELRILAVKAGAQKAVELSEAAGTRPGKLHSISELDFRQLSTLTGQDPDWGMAASMAGPERVYDPPATLTYYSHIRLLYHLEQ